METRTATWLTFALVVFLAGVVYGKTHGDVASEPYSPTKLDWATVEFNTRVMGTLGHRTNVRVYCTHAKPPHTIVCPIFRAPDVDQASANAAAKIVGELFDAYKEARGFDWLNLELNTPSPLGKQLR